MFAKRTDWNLTKNKLTLLLEEKKSKGIPIIDFTESNPTRCGFEYPEKEILSAFQNPKSLTYEPNPRGLEIARNAVLDYYKSLSKELNPNNLFLTASTSESYSFLFRLLANPGDSILVPQPSYPLFQVLAEINDVDLQPYQMLYHNGWYIDLESIEKSIGHRTKAIILVNPNNPTGSFVQQKELAKLIKICKEHNLALISDEVFSDYAYAPSPTRVTTLAGLEEVPTFVLNGISKMLALPQMKLGWLYASGPDKIIQDAVSRLEMISDTYLSVGTPIQQVLPSLMQHKSLIQQQIKDRVLNNRLTLLQSLRQPTPVCLEAEGGWYAVLQVSGKINEENLVLELLEKENILVHPGYFFDFLSEGYLIISLLPKEDIFKEGIQKLLNFIDHKLKEKTFDQLKSFEK